MFGDPVGNTKRWPKSSFGEQLTLIQYGPRFYNEPYTKAGIRTVRITDLNVSGQLSFDQMPRIDASEHAVKSFSLTPGDMIFARSGATVGKTALIEEGDPPCLAGAYFLRMRFSGSVLPRYARMVITANSVQKIIAEQSRQSAQQNFSGPAVRRLPLPLPPLELQQEFVQLENQVRAHMKNLSIQMSDAESLNSSLNVRAFRGEI
jgi:type I restriction enzyme S subunit